ncbi:MAG: NfeD family protein [Actinomycetia bacterium]|nr:NfeD family protein [Actinomycetes bacterium]MCP4087794.1 NfeD family protein [Actinomycetes bacterium]
MDADIWRWIWLVAAATFTLGEMAMAGTFFLFPFAIGAILAAILSFLGVDVGISWLAFVVGSGASFAALRPLARRLDQGETVDGIGARRLIGESGVVLQAIPGGAELGLIRVGREEWRAEAADQRALAEGIPIKIIEIRGTRAVVWPASEPDPT